MLLSQKKCIKRILDVNINRAREGLRVIEDYSRFALNARKLTAGIKEVRHLISKAVDRFDLVAARASEKDIGRSPAFDKKIKAGTTKNVIIANIIRVEESARVLEEFSKVVYPKSSATFKKARFLLYDLEKEFIKKAKRSLRNN
ncbi:MAG: thiamine-phosphate pyrophosphorylase [Candidatus Firestonebacteria bacterium]|nr:thiamine-phosphate pyrophosphorylase [Candidatus Firestonebacteria bacterium]